MAKKAKMRKHWMPPLSFWDEVIYWLVFMLLIALIFSMFLGTVILRSRIAFRDEMVIASEDNISLLWSLIPMITVFLIMFTPWVIAYQDRKPIFGLRNFKYGPPEWPKVYPLFMKKKPSVYASDRKKKGRVYVAVILLVVLLISFIPYPLSLFGRDCLRSDGSIVQYNMFNSRTRVFRSGDIKSVEMEAHRYTTGKSGKEHWGVRMAFVTDDGRRYCFEHSEFRDDVKGDIQYWLAAMLQVKSRYDPGIFTYGGMENLEKVVLDKNLTDVEIQILYQLFGQ